MALTDNSGVYTVVTSLPVVFTPLAIRTTESTIVVKAFAKAAAPRGVDGLVWPTGVQRFGGSASEAP